MFYQGERGHKNIRERLWVSYYLFNSFVYFYLESPIFWKALVAVTLCPLLRHPFVSFDFVEFGWCKIWKRFVLQDFFSPFSVSRTSGLGVKKSLNWNVTSLTPMSKNLSDWPLSDQCFRKGQIKKQLIWKCSKSQTRRFYFDKVTNSGTTGSESFTSNLTTKSPEK